MPAPPYCSSDLHQQQALLAALAGRSPGPPGPAACQRSRCGSTSFWKKRRTESRNMSCSGSKSRRSMRSGSRAALTGAGARVEDLVLRRPRPAARPEPRSAAHRPPPAGHTRPRRPSDPTVSMKDSVPPVQAGIAPAEDRTDVRVGGLGDDALVQAADGLHRLHVEQALLHLFHVGLLRGRRDRLPRCRARGTSCRPSDTRRSPCRTSCPSGRAPRRTSARPRSRTGLCTCRPGPPASACGSSPTAPG